MLGKEFIKMYNEATVASGIISTERTVIGYILNWIRLIGTGMALVMLTFMALHYLNATPLKREEVKKRLGNFAIGAVVFIGAGNILYYAEQIVEDIVFAIFS